MKFCAGCEQNKEETEFARHTHSPDGRRSRCRDCVAVYNRGVRDRLKSQFRAEDCPTEKRCRECERIKPSSEFTKTYASADGLKPNCKACHRVLRRAKRAEDEFVLAEKGYARKQRLTRPENYLYGLCKRRATKHGLPFDIEVEDIVIPTHCPVLGIKLEPGEGSAHAGSPSVDKLVPKLGYVKGNIAVISFRANALKRDATPEEIEKLSAWMASSVQQRTYH